jgi:hypothetical protein
MRPVHHGAAGALLLVLAAWPIGSADAQSGGCRRGNEVVQPGTTMCLEGFTNTCQPNGAWISDRAFPCMEPVFRPGKSCTISRTQSAAPGARACVAGKRRECAETGVWIDLGNPC